MALGLLLKEYLATRKKRSLVDVLQRMATELDVSPETYFLDVGAGGPIKEPWSWVQNFGMKKIAFDPDIDAVPKEGLLKAFPFCLGNNDGTETLKLTKDPRNSSLLPFSDEFLSRFGQTGYDVDKLIELDCVRGDSLLQEYDVDFVDINAEGFDFQVIEGLQNTLSSKACLVKVEFEFFNVYQGQGSFGLIQEKLSSLGFELMDLDGVEYGSEKEISGLLTQGPLLWGKMLWLRTSDSLRDVITNSNAPRRKLLANIAANLMIMGGGHALRSINVALELEIISKAQAHRCSEIVNQYFAIPAWVKIIRRIK